jgi:hypothetical protein
MDRRPFAALLVLAAACGEPPPPPKPPPALPERLAAARVRLRKLAEDQLAAAPQDAPLKIWVAALQGAEAPPGPLAAVVRASKLPDDEAARAVEAALPGSSHASLFKAHAGLRRARANPAYPQELADTIEEALQRKSWDCPVAAFHQWALDWLERNEPDVAVRVCFPVPYVNGSRAVLAPLVAVVEGLARTPARPTRLGRRPADLARRLLEERFLRSPSAPDVLLGQAALETVLEAQFLTAWKQQDLETMRSASLALEEWGRRQAALLGWSAEYRNRRRLGETIGQLTADRPPPPEAFREIAAGAKEYWQALRADGRPILPTLEARRPAQSPRRNYLGFALRDRSFLFTNDWPKDSQKWLLDVAFDGGLDDGQTMGLQAYAWVVRENLVRPTTIPAAQLRKRFNAREGPPDRSAQNLDVAAILRIRKEDLGAEHRPDPAALRKLGATSLLHGYALLVRELAKAKSPETPEWLPEPQDGAPSALEVLISETLRGATEQDFGLDWARWRAFLSSK